MPRDIPAALKLRQLLKLLERAGCSLYREGKGDHRLYVRVVGDRKRVVPIDMGVGEFSPPLVLRILRQFSCTDREIEDLFR